MIDPNEFATVSENCSGTEIRYIRPAGSFHRWEGIDEIIFSDGRRSEGAWKSFLNEGAARQWASFQDCRLGFTCRHYGKEECPNYS